MDHETRNRYILIGVIAFCVAAASILLVFAIFKFEVIKDFCLMIWRILTPFLYGFVLAYLLLPVYNFLLNLFHKLFFKKERSEKAARRLRVVNNAISVILTMVFFLALVIGFGFLVLPELGQSIVSIVRSAPETGKRIMNWAEKLLHDNPEIEATVTDIIERYVGNLNTWAETYLLPHVTKVVNGLSNGIIGTLTGTFTFLKNALIGLIAAIYMLVSKNLFAAQSKKLVYSVFSVKTANVFLDNVRFVHRTFSGFITGKLLDSLIIGFISYFFMSVVNMPYAMLVSVIIGVTNIIPFFGPFIGAVPSALLILTVSPIQCLYFVIFAIILQQFDGNVLGPRIIGGSVGLSSFWVMFSILFFSGLFGFMGMIIGVPLFALLVSLIAALCKRSLQRKSLPVESTAYAGVQEIDPETGERVMLPSKPKMRDKPNGLVKRLFDKFKKKS